MKIRIASGSLSLDTFARMAGGRLCLRDLTAPPTVTGLCTDSREADADTLFVAIRGERVDGHRFIAATARAGCVAFLCERLPDGWESESEPPAAAVVVPDSVEALGRIARAWRTERTPNTTLVAITGSVGKTTTKEMAAAVLSASGKSFFKKDGNYNSTIGLPLSLLEMAEGTEMAVVEMGMSGRGEISAMSAAARPQIAVITNIGSSHLELLGTRENIARAKLEIAEGLPRGGILLYNGDEPLLSALGQNFAGEKPHLPPDIRPMSLSPSGGPSAFSAIHAKAVDGGMQFDLQTPDGVLSELFVPAPGEHMVAAGAFAAAVGLLSGMEPDAIRAGLRCYRAAALRQGMRTVAGVTLLEDCYNAAPESMAAALSVLGLVSAAGRRVAVLGDMKELGENTVALHRAVGESVARLKVDLLVTVGELGAHIAAGALAAGLPAHQIHITASDGNDPTEAYPATAAWLANCLRPGDTVLFKASRAMALERLSAALAAHWLSETD